MTVRIILLVILAIACFLVPTYLHRPITKEEIEMRYPPPRFTEQWIISPGIAGGGTSRREYPVAHERIAKSGCVEIGGYFGAAQMNCALRYYGLPETAMSGARTDPQLIMLSGVAITASPAPSADSPDS